MSPLHSFAGPKNAQKKVLYGDVVYSTTGLICPVVTSLPAASPGGIVFNSSNDLLYYSDGTTWYTAGTNALPAGLQSIGDLTTVGDQMLYTTAPDTYATATSTAQGRTIMGSSTASDQRSAMGVRIGSDVQAYDPGLDSLAGLVAANDEMIYATAPDTYNTTTLTPYARTLNAAANAAAARTTIDVPQTAAVTTTNAVVKWSDATGLALSNTGVEIDGSNNVTGVQDLDVQGDITMAVTSNLDGITPAERNQIKNIGATTIGAAAWGHAGAMNQDVATTSTPTFTGLSAGNALVTDVAAPAGNTDAANKQYVDTVAGAGVNPTDSVVATSLVNIAGYVANTFPGGPFTLDGRLLLDTERALIKEQTNPVENGIYYYDLATTTLRRTTDFATGSAQTQNLYVLVTEGATLTNSSWVLKDNVAVVGTNINEWVGFSGPTAIAAGNGIAIGGPGTTISTDIVGAPLQFTGGQLDILTPLTVPYGGTGQVALTANRVLVGNGVGAVDLSKAAPTGTIVGTTDVQVLTNKTITDAGSHCRASALETSGADVGITSTAPVGAGYFLLSTNATTATWQLYSGTSPARTYTVAPTGATYTTIAAALAAIAPVPTEANPALVVVYPGTYNEVNPLIVPSYVAIQGQGTFGTVRVTPTDNTKAIFQMGGFGGVYGVNMVNANGVGGIGVDIPSGSVFVMIDHCRIIDCTTGMRVTGTGYALLTTCIIQAIFSAVTYGVHVRQGGTLLATTCRVMGHAANYVGIGYYVEGFSAGVKGSSSRITDCSTEYCDRGYVVDGGGGGAGETADFEISSSEAENGQTENLYCGSNSVMNAVGFVCDNATGYTGDDLHVNAATSEFYGVGNRISAGRVNLNPSATVVAQNISTDPAQAALSILGDLYVGSYQFPRTSMFGEGGRHTDDMYVYTATAAGVFTYQPNAVLEDGNRFLLFPATAVDNACYVGFADTTVASGFPGIRVNGLDIAMVYGAGSLTWEYWNGAWTTFHVMARQADPDYLPRAEVGAFAYLEDQNIRFGEMTGWTTYLLAATGITAWWIRMRITGAAITTIPRVDQIQLSTNKTQINSDGYVESFGTARDRKKLQWQYGVISALDDLPASEDTYIGKYLAVNRLSEFQSGRNDRLNLTTMLPFDMDTSMNIKLIFYWYRDSNTAMDWIVRYTSLSEGSATYATQGAAPDPAANENSVTKSISAGVGPQPTTYQQIASVVELPVYWMLPGRGGTSTFGDEAVPDLLFLSFERTDSNGGNAIVMEIQGTYGRCCLGFYDV